MMHTRATAAVLAGSLLVSLAPPADGSSVRVLYSGVPGSPTAAVPGLPGVEFETFNRPYGSESGARWILECNTDEGFLSDNTLILLGSGTSGTVVLHEGDPAPWPGAAGETIDLIDEQMGVTDSGMYAYSVNTFGGPDDADEYILRFSPGIGHEVIAQENDTFPAILGARWGVILDETHILTDGRVGFRSINTYELPTSSNTLLALGTTIVRAQEGVDIPAGQVLVGMETWRTFNFYGYRHSADGSTFLAEGQVNGDLSRNDVVTVDNIVRIQETGIVPGFLEPVSSSLHDASVMMPDGTWFARGVNMGGQDWVVRNGAVIHFGGQAITPGSSEVWDALALNGTFVFHVGNANGDSVVCGKVASGVEVVVRNGIQEIIREGAPVDVDNNGMLDDGAFLGAFVPDHAFLTDAGRLYAVIELVDDVGADVGEAFVRIATTCPGDLNGDGATDSADLSVVIANFGRVVFPGSQGDVNGDGVVDSADLSVVVGDFGCAI